MSFKFLLMIGWVLIATQLFGQSPVNYSAIAKTLRPEVAELIANRLTEKFQQADAADENGYIILSSQQSASGKPLILLLRDQEWLVQEIAWDTARGSDDPEAPWPATPTPLDFFSCYALSGPLKGRIEKCEHVASLNDLRVVSTKRVDGGLEIELGLEFKSRGVLEPGAFEGEWALRVDFADANTRPRLVRLKKLPEQHEEGKVTISVPLTIDHLPPRSSAELMVDVVRIQRSTGPDVPTTVASVSNTVLTSVNVHSLYRMLSSSP